MAIAVTGHTAVTRTSHNYAMHPQSCNYYYYYYYYYFIVIVISGSSIIIIKPTAGQIKWGKNKVVYKPK